MLVGGPALGFGIGADLAACTTDFDVLIDFTLPESTLRHVEICRAAGKAMVIGTTGLGDARGQIEAAATAIPIVFAPNMSVGVNSCFTLLDLAARVLGDAFDVGSSKPITGTRSTRHRARPCAWAKWLPPRSAAISPPARSTAARATPGRARADHRLRNHTRG